MKRLFDIFVSGILLIVLLPLFAALALLISLDGHPPYFLQTRIGYRGRQFKIWKFRSMIYKAEDRLEAILADDAVKKETWLEKRKLENDPRITLIGRFIRRHSFDELPQLFNVLRGDMSLVGPRPILPSELELWGENIHIYYECKPGITGLWQVSGRNALSYAKRIDLDIYYIKNRSLYIDLKILIKTIIEILFPKSAH